MIENHQMKNLYKILLFVSLAGCTKFSTPSSLLPSSTGQAVPQAALQTSLVAETQPPAAIPRDPFVKGIIVDTNGDPVSGATVRIQATTLSTSSDANGGFTLNGLQAGSILNVSAWKEGYYCAIAQDVVPPQADVRLELRLYQTNDNPSYRWVPPTGDNSCFSCKPAVTQIWLENDTHGKSGSNLRFLSMYNGTDIHGNLSPLTRRISTRDYGSVPLPPDLSKPYYGPGYKLDFPANTGNCATCHIPAAAIDQPYNVDPNQVSDLDRKFGIHCDFCHKIAKVKLSPETQMPYPNMPGVLSMDIRRPFPEDKDRYQLFFGTFDDDNVPLEDTRLPLIEQSQFCAPCHFGVFWDTLVYNSYGEWLASPYSNPQSGKTCQQCHTPAPSILDGQKLTNVAPGKGGVERSPNTIHAHTFPGAASQELLQNAVTMTAESRPEGDRVAVNVSITNDLTGHHVPTDSPLRHLILLVEALDLSDQPLELLEGSTVPDWGGVGDPAEGYYAGLPGKAYAKVLTELWTEISPSGAYWNQTRIESDNRLAAFETDQQSFLFSAPKGTAKIEVKLIYRRAYKSLMDQKGWDFPDILMEQVTLPMR
jgi:hypothetical protein